MGYSLSWLAVRGKSAEAVRDELGFRLTGKRERIPEAALSAVEMPNGWYLIVSNRSEQVAADATMQRLSSSGCELVTCFVEEHVMASSASAWAGGQSKWSVTHDAQQGHGHLEAHRELPPSYTSILNRLSTKQQDADANNERVDFIFDVPVELAHSIVGYRHDKDVPGLSGEIFEVLAGAVQAGAPQKSSLWKRLFGV
jgi:hypothetical protein